ncbi:trace amine-associated receptor 7a-like [Hippocampus zosterae]|uniref:trace amine-associated receptor 7a-like n=1 Tax=Hippocampus zosterae TaxID=109293 RepID=UPI00223DA28A|nr:trace amine-associated receptor 7a-like [Hippocampus zosterae]
MEAEERRELCFPQLGNLSCRKPPPAGVLPQLLLYALCALTVLLNLLVIAAISHFRRLRTPTNLLLLSLAVCDLLVGLLVWPGEIYMSGGCWALGAAACSCYHLASFAVTSASVGHVALISAERYVAVCDPLRYGVRVTVKRIGGCVCLCWLLSFLYCCALLGEPLARPHERGSCRGECVMAVDVDAGLVDLMVIFVLPLCVIVSLYVRVFAAAASQARALRWRLAGGAKRSELKAARTLGVLVLVFLLCYCPFYIVALVGDLGFSSAAQYALYLLDFNSCVNPLIYALFYPWFRRAVWHIVTLRVLRPGSRGAHVL